MRTAKAMWRVAQVAPAGAVGTALVCCRDRRWLPAQAQQRKRFDELPSNLSMQLFRPAAPYPAWDNNWDYCDMDQEAIAKCLNHDWPITDYPMAIRKLFAEHTDKKVHKVDKGIEAHIHDLPGLYKRAFIHYAYGGAATRHIILVRHGQYEERTGMARRLVSENPHHFGLPGDTKRDELDRAQVLTPLGRRQAERVGDRLNELLQPALDTLGREAHVRIHVSTLERAKETADIIASRLPDHVRRIEPNPMLVEGYPAAHVIPSRGGESSLWKRAREVHIEGARMEAAFRSLFYRDLPCKPPDKVDSDVGKADEGAGKPRQDQRALPRHEYDIVVCHMNLIRYFTLRALQLPPEAWLRLGGNNGSLTHLKIRPSGSVTLVCFGDSGHLPLEEVSFGRHMGLER